MLSTARIGGDRWRAILGAFLIAMIAIGCATGAAAPGLGAAPGGNGPESGGLDQGNGGQGAGGANDDQNAKRLFAIGQEDLLIIKTGSLAIQVTGIDAALTAASLHITGLGGYASGSDRSGEGEFDQATVTYRIPAARWDEALAGLRGLGTKVLAERSSTEDVTDQVVDLGARIRNLQASETALQAIMDRATEIEDVLAVQAELTTVRGQIEQLTAQKTQLEAQAAFSTLSVTFALKPDPLLSETQGFDPASEVERASANLVGVLQGLATAGIWFAIVWLPVLLALGVLLAIGAFVFRRFRRSTPATPAMPAPGPGA